MLASDVLLTFSLLCIVSFVAPNYESLPMSKRSIFLSKPISWLQQVNTVPYVGPTTEEALKWKRICYAGQLLYELLVRGEQDFVPFLVELMTNWHLVRYNSMMKWNIVSYNARMIAENLWENYKTFPLYYSQFQICATSIPLMKHSNHHQMQIPIPVQMPTQLPLPVLNSDPKLFYGPYGITSVPQ